MNNQLPNESSMTRTQPKGRSGTIADEQWEQARPVLKHLYEEQGLKLKQVKAMMATTYNFFATDQMYKKRFR